MASLRFTFLCFLACLCLKAQTITGTVTNSSGNTITNALVCLKDTPATHTKTDSNGNFTINAPVGATLKIAALHFKTVSSFITNGTSNQNIVLEKDPLLATDVFHISFDHLRVGNSYTKNELKTDFNLAYSKGFFDGSAGSDRASIDYTESRDPNGVSLKVRFPKGKLKTADSGVDTRIDLEGVFNNNTFASEDLYLSYWVKFSSNFEFDKCGGKLPSLGGSTFNSSKNRWKGRIMWRKGGSIQFYMELPDSRFTPTDEERFWGRKTKEGSGICDFEYMPYLGSPGWHNIELHYRFETPGTSDGVFEGWVDGENFDSMNASVFNNYRPQGTSRENITINNILLSAFLGGSNIEDYAPTEDIYAWFDEFRVSEQRINEWGDYNYNQTLSAKSVSNTKIINRVRVFPNPSENGLFQLNTPNLWCVYNLLGVKIAAGSGTIIDLSTADSGTYILRTANGNSKLIKP